MKHFSTSATGNKNWITFGWFWGFSSEFTQ